MATRYKKIRINDLRQGRGQIYQDDGKKMFYQSKGIDIDLNTGRLRLAQAVQKDTKVNWFQYNLNGQHNCRHYFSGDFYTFFLLFDATAARLKLFYMASSTSEIARLTFAAAFTEGYYILDYKRKLIIQTLKSAAVNISYSTDDGASFTDAAWTYGKIIRHTTDETGKLWVITATGYVITTTDGITWTQVFYDANILPVEIGYLDGFIYLIITDAAGLSSRLARIENLVIKELTDLHTEISAVSMIVQEDRRLLIAKIDNVSKCRVYEWTKGELTEISFIDFVGNLTQIRFICGNRKAVYLVIGYYYIYKINRYNGAFYLYSILDQVDEFAKVVCGCIDENASSHDGDLRLVCNSGDGVTLGTTISPVSPTAFLTSGALYLSIFDVGGHGSGYLIARHDPLGATGSLVVKAKKNKESTYATTLLTSNTAGATNKEVALKTLLASSLNYLQLELTLADSGSANGIKELEIIYLYTPTGIENAQ